MDQFLGEQQRYRRDDDEDVGRAEVAAFQAAENDAEEEVEKKKNEGDQVLQPHVEREARATGHRALSAPRISAARAEGMEISPSHRALPAPAADRRQDNRRAPDPPRRLDYWEKSEGRRGNSAAPRDTSSPPCKQGPAKHRARRRKGSGESSEGWWPRLCHTAPERTSRARTGIHPPHPSRPRSRPAWPARHPAPTGAVASAFWFASGRANSSSC